MVNNDLTLFRLLFRIVHFKGDLGAVYLTLLHECSKLELEFQILDLPSERLVLLHAEVDLVAERFVLVTNRCLFFLKHLNFVFQAGQV